MFFQGVLDGNCRSIVKSIGSMSGLMQFKSRFGDVLSMSLSFPGDQNFARRIEMVQRMEPKTSRVLSRVKNIPTKMLENFNLFASAENCAANIRE